MRSKWFIAVICWLFALSLLSCQPLDTQNLATNLGSNRGFQMKIWDVEPFFIYSLWKPGRDYLHIYFEGDGQAYLDYTKISNDPTPKYPVALKIAVNDPTSAAILYLARPGQFLTQVNSASLSKYWTQARFSQEVVQAYATLIDRAKQLLKVEKLIFIGYSGGAALAALVASQRSDVVYLASVGGNLNLECWIKQQKLSPLTESMDPMLVVAKLKKIPQRHVIGSQDKVIPKVCLEEFCRQAKNNGTQVELWEIPNLGHNSPWHKIWDYQYLK